MSLLEMLLVRLEIPAVEEGTFLYCAECPEVHRVTRADRAPVYSSEGAARPADDLQGFLVRHLEHPLRVLHRSSEAEVHSHARHDPMCRVLWEVDDEERNTFVVSLGREDVESPRRYAIQPGRLAVAAESIDLDVDLLRSVVDEALFPHPAPDSRLDRFVEACRRAVARLPWESYDPVDEARDDPDTLLACLPGPILAAVAAEVCRTFPGSDGNKVLELLERDLRDEIPVVRLRRRYTIVPR